MRPEIVFRKSLNGIFGGLCLTVCIQFLISLLLASVDGWVDFTGAEGAYLRDFVLPQLLYPVLNLCLAFFILYLLRRAPSSVMALSSVKGSDLVLWTGLFLGASAVGNIVITWFFLWLEQFGISFPSAFAQYDPQTPEQAILYVIVIVLLPALSEEVLFRAVVAGSVREFHPGAAVLLSALGFGLMHANLQQIPFAFLLGLILGLVYVKTGNILYPVLLHFINNAWACTIRFLQIFLSEEVAGTVQGICMILFFLFGLISLVFLIRRRSFSLGEHPALLTGKEVRGGVVRSVGFWSFVGLYLLMTVLSLCQ